MWMDEPFGMFSVMNTLFPILFFGIFALISGNFIKCRQHNSFFTKIFGLFTLENRTGNPCDIRGFNAAIQCIGHLHNRALTHAVQ